MLKGAGLHWRAYSGIYAGFQVAVETTPVRPNSRLLGHADDPTMQNSAWESVNKNFKGILFGANDKKEYRAEIL